MHVKDQTSSLKDPDQRRTVAQITLRLLNQWKLDPSDQCLLLGLSPDDHATLRKFREGAEYAFRKDTLERCGQLLAIHESLRTLYPENREIVYGWMTHRNQRFGDQPPIEYIRSEGLEGLKAIRRYLAYRQTR